MTKTKLLFIGMALALVTWVGASAASSQDGPSLSADPATVSEAGEHTFTITGSGWSVNPNVGFCTDPENAYTGGCDFSSFRPVTATDGGFEIERTYNVPAGGIFITAGDAAQTESALAHITVGASTDDSADDSDDTGSDDSADDSDDTGDMDGDSGATDEDSSGDDSGDMGDEDTGDMDGDDSGDMGDEDTGDMGDGDDSMDDGDMDADDSGDMDDGDDSMDDGDMGDGDDSMDSGDMGDGDDSMDDGDMGDEAMDDGDDMGDGDMDDDMAEDTTMPATGSNTPLLAIIALSVVLAGAMVLSLSRRLRTQ